jgi:putative Holliday junction resolvase
MQSRRLMGIDHGEKRIGVALSDPLGLFASPLCVIQVASDRQAIEAIGQITEQQQVVKIVIGLPSSAQGTIGAQAQVVVRWARKLARRVAIPVIFWDESFSSVEAEQRRPASRRSRSGPGRPLDDVAAASILQDYLDAGGGEHEPGQPLESLTGQG